MNLREELSSRPMLWWFAALMLGLVAPTYTLAFFGFALIIGLICWFQKYKVAAGIILFFACGFLNGPRIPAELSAPIDYSGEAVVTQMPRAVRTGERYWVSLEEKSYLYYATANRDLSWGDTIGFNGSIRPLPESSSDYFRHMGVQGSIRPTGEVKLLRRGPPIARWGNQVRRDFSAAMKRLLSAKSAAVIQALCFNQDNELDTEFRQQLVNSGTVHIISTSGMHVVLLAGMIAAFLHYLPIPRWAQLGILFMILAIYGLAAGLRPPMLRSVLMALGIYSAYLFKRQSDGLSLVGLSGIATLLIMPYAIFDIGFQLSFIAIAGLVMFGNIEWLTGTERTISQFILNRVKRILESSFVATVAGAPLLLHYFGQVSWIGAFSNLIIVPVVPIVTAVSLIVWLLEAPAPWLAQFAASYFIEPLSLFIIGIIRVTGSPDWVVFKASNIPFWLVIVLYLGLVSLWRPKREKIPD